MAKRSEQAEFTCAYFSHWVVRPSVNNHLCIWSLSLLNQKNISFVDHIHLLTSVCFSFVHSATSISSSFSVTSSSTSEPSMSEFMFSVESSADLQSPLSSPEGDSYFDKEIITMLLTH